MPASIAAHGMVLGCRHKPLFSGADAKRFDTRLVKLDDLGYGAFGRVEKVTFGSLCLARKRIPRRRGFTIDDLRQEGLTMRKLDHRHVVKLVATYAPRPHELCLLIWPAAVCNLSVLLEDIEALRLGEGDREDILERLHALDLTDLSAIEPAVDAQCFRSTAKCPLDFLRNIIGCTTRALAYCHASDVRHLDIKPSNILLRPGRVYLADFGISRDVSGQDQTTAEGLPGTERWRAPELYGEQGSSMQLSDIYSLGLVFLNIATILYNARLHDFDDALNYSPRQTREEQLRAREVKLETHLNKLISHALVTPPFMFTFEGQETVRPRPLVHLIRRMVASAPRDRASADKIDDKLSMLGGIHQIYHDECCKRPISWVEDKWDKKLAAMTNLRKENERHRRRIQELEGKDYTYELRLENARQVHEHDVNTLQARLRAAEERCRALEAEKAELARGAGRPPTRQSTLPKAKRNSIGGPSDVGYTLTKTRSTPATPVARPTIQPKSWSTSRYITTLASAGHRSSPAPTPSGIPMARTNSSDFQGPHRTPSVTSLGGYVARTRGSGSKLPLPVTPNRTSTPTLARDQSLTDSSMSSSIFSKQSVETTPTPLYGSPAVDRQQQFDGEQAPSWGKLEELGKAPAVTTGSEAKPSSERPSTPPRNSISSVSVASSPRTMRSELSSDADRTRVPTLSSMKSWAEVVRRPDATSLSLRSLVSRESTTGV
jgi:serine/threonine protein kinase